MCVCACVYVCVCVCVCVCRQNMHYDIYSKELVALYLGQLAWLAYHSMHALKEIYHNYYGAWQYMCLTRLMYSTKLGGSVRCMSMVITMLSGS